MDHAPSLVIASDGAPVLTGYSESTDIYGCPGHGSTDGSQVKLKAE